MVRFFSRHYGGVRDACKIKIDHILSFSRQMKICRHPPPPPFFSKSSKMCDFDFAGIPNIKIICTWRVDQHQAPCLSGIYLYMVIYWLSTPLFLHILSPDVQFWRAQDFSVGTIGVKHQNNLYSESRSASGPMFNRGFPLYGYLLTVYTLIFAYFIARFKIFRHDYNGQLLDFTALVGIDLPRLKWAPFRLNTTHRSSTSDRNSFEGHNNFEGRKIFLSALWEWNIKIIATLRVDR